MAAGLFSGLEMREEGGITPEILLRPLLVRMIVALCTLQLHTQKRARGTGGQLFRLQFPRTIKQLGTRIRRRSFGHQQFGHDYIVACVFGKTVAQPGFKASDATEPFQISSLGE